MAISSEAQGLPGSELRNYYTYWCLENYLGCLDSNPSQLQIKASTLTAVLSLSLSDLNICNTSLIQSFKAKPMLSIYVILFLNHRS